MDRLHEGIALGFILGILHGLMQPGHSVPVAQLYARQLDLKDGTTSVVTEVINSMDYNTGYQYSVTGTNIKNTGNSIALPQPQETAILLMALPAHGQHWMLQTTVSWSIIDNTKAFNSPKPYKLQGWRTTRLSTERPRYEA